MLSDMTYRITRHAAEEMVRRGITEQELAAAMASVPGLPGRDGLEVRQAVVSGYLIRAIVNHTLKPERVVTVYRTSKLKKYGAAP
jgi:hypothetical protein